MKKSPDGWRFLDWEILCLDIPSVFCLFEKTYPVATRSGKWEHFILNCPAVPSLIEEWWINLPVDEQFKLLRGDYESKLADVRILKDVLDEMTKPKESAA